MGAKLLRDNIFSAPWSDEETKDGIRRYTRPVKNVQEHIKLLRSKLGEELGELLTAEGDELLDEAADVYELLICLLAKEGYDLAKLQEHASSKRSIRGGFIKGLVWDTSITPSSETG